MANVRFRATPTNRLIVFNLIFLIPDDESSPPAVDCGHGDG